MEMANRSPQGAPVRVPLPLLQDMTTKIMPYVLQIDSNSISDGSYVSLLTYFLNLFNQLPSDKKQEYIQNECPWFPSGLNLEVILNQQPFIDCAENWSCIQRQDDYRVEGSNKSGGLSLLDQVVVSKIRSVATEILKQLGKKLLSGNFNLTQVSFPIRCMQAMTALHTTLNTFQMIPLYVAKAVVTPNHVERMKLVIISMLSSFLHTSTFEKPLNPILGETLLGILEDGTKLFAEQTSHHPPVSHYYVEGNGFRVSGYFNYTAKAGLNSVTVINIGKKTFEFFDGYVVSLSCPEELFSGTFFGTMKHESLGSIKANDNDGNYCVINLGKIKGKPSDYLQGIIYDAGGNQLSKLEGTYLGYLEFDKIRYWDARYVRPYAIRYQQALLSDSETRKDILVLRSGNVDQAQTAKEELENIQRNDRKLRNKFHK